MTEETMPLTVGQPLDITPSQEGYVPVLNGPSFDIVALYSDITQTGLNDWLYGPIQHGVYVEKSVPIFILDLGQTWNLDISLNILSEDEEIKKKFFESDPNYTRMHLILTSYPDTIVQAIRTIAIDPELMRIIKEVCFNQVSKYSSHEECQAAIEELRSKWSSKALRAIL